MLMRENPGAGNRDGERGALAVHPVPRNHPASTRTLLNNPVTREDSTVHTTNDVPVVGSILRRGGLFAVVLAIIWGFLAMHVVVGAHAAPMTSHSVSGAQMASGMTGHASHGTTHAVPAAGSPAGASSEHRVELQLTCDCSSSGCADGASTHEDCVPAPVVPTPALPPPGTLTVFSAGAAFAAVQQHTAQGRIPDSPSPEQLSISRT